MRGHGPFSLGQKMHYYPHHIGDFIKDTSNLTDHQCITYLRMCWRYYLDEKPITGELEDLAFEMRTDEKTVRLLLKFYFTKTEDGWRHKRIDKELAAYARKSELARKSANARWKDANAMRTQCERNANATKIDANQEPITNNQDKKEKNKQKKKENWARPNGVDKQAWEEFEQHRKDINKPMSDIARTKNANVLTDFLPSVQRDMVDATIRSGWTGIFPLKGGANGTHHKIPESRSAKAMRIFNERHGTDSAAPVQVDGGELRADFHSADGRPEDPRVVGEVVDGEYRRETP